MHACMCMRACGWTFLLVRPRQVGRKLRLGERGMFRDSSAGSHREPQPVTNGHRHSKSDRLSAVAIDHEHVSTRAERKAIEEE